MAGKIVLVLALLDENHGPHPLVVYPGGQRGSGPVDRCGARGLGIGILGLERIVDNDEITATAGKCAPGRGRNPEAPGSGEELTFRGAVWDARRWKQCTIPVGLHHLAGLTAKVGSQVLVVTDHDDPLGGIKAKQERWQGHRDNGRLGRARRKVNDQPIDLARNGGDAKQIGDRFVVPPELKGTTRVEFAKNSLGKGQEVIAQQGVEQATIEGHVHWSSSGAEGSRSMSPRARALARSSASSASSFAVKSMRTSTGS